MVYNLSYPFLLLNYFQTLASGPRLSLIIAGKDTNASPRANLEKILAGADGKVSKEDVARLKRNCAAEQNNWESFSISGLSIVSRCAHHQPRFGRK